MHIIIALASLLATSSVAQQYLIASLDLQSDITAVDVHNTKIYVASVNRLSCLNLTANLQVVATVITGPQYDSVLCNYDGASCLRNARLTKQNYASRLLHVTKKHEILECGSLRQGVCQQRDPLTLTVIRNGSVPVVPNDNNSSCVSLVDENDILYVASTYTSESPYRESMPAICSREPPDYNTINAGSIEGEAAVHIRYEYRRSLRVNYVAAFFHQHYIYFISVQQEQNKRLTQKLLQQEVKSSKLIRICKDDARYVSYSEIEFRCLGDDNHNFNHVTTATLIRDTVFAAFTDNSRSKSAICIYPMSKINMHFWYNLDRCHSGSDATVGLPHIGRDTKCVNRSHLRLPNDTCAVGVGGTLGCDEISDFELNTVVDASASTIVENITVLIVGTQHGSILQLHYHHSEIEKYNEQILHDKPITHIRFVDRFSYIVTSGSKIFQMSINDCASRTSCKQCIIGNSPFCGWCLLDGRCTVRSQCSSSIYLTDSCPVTDATIPSNISTIPSDKKIFVPLGRYPIANKTPFVCVYETESRRGRWLDGGIVCEITKKQINYFTGDHTLINIRIFYAENSRPVTERALIVYNCSSYSMCTSCTRTPWKCHWCSSGNVCTTMEVECKGTNKPSECPHIGSAKEEHLYISTEQTVPISFNVDHLDQLTLPSGKLFCNVTVQDEQIQLSANFYRNHIKCDGKKLNFNLSKAVENGQLSLLRETTVIDVANVTLYSCLALASDCSSCFSLDSKWNCGWCSGKCDHRTNCNYTMLNQSPDTICGQPIIYTIKPESGPVEGGTRVEIRGRDLGFSLKDIENKVFIGKSKCNVVEYELASKIICIVEPGEEGSFAVQLHLGKTGRRYAKSNALYNFVRPYATHIFPKFGPRSGGTKVIVYGSNLIAGTNISIAFGDIPCNVITEGERQPGIVCSTGPSESVTSKGPVRIEIDKHIQMLQTSFEYRPDPSIKSIYPTATFKSGGRLIAVEGEFLDSVLHPRIFISATNDSHDGSISELGDCVVQNSTSMFCRTPKVDIPSDFPSATYSRWPIGFLMDNVISVQNFGYSHLQMTVVPDPIFAPFNGIRMHKPGQLFVIEGTHLSHAAFPNEYQIFIGSSHCLVTQLEEERLFCRGPDVQPHASDEKGNIVEGGRPLFVVIIGSLRYELGLVEYEIFSFRVLAKPVLLFLLTLFVLSVVVGFLLYFIYKKRKLEYDGNYKRIHVKIDDLRNDVRYECKHVTSELQSEMTELSSFTESQGIPFFEKTQFASRLLLHDVTLLANMLSNENGYSSEPLDAIVQLDALLWNKQFVLALVKIVETDYSLSIQDRSLFASLLTATLLRNMNYFTDVVITLLSYHFGKCIKNRNAHLLFRQNGSIIEKIFSFWFAFCLYDDLRSNLAHRFYLLEEAIRHQIAKGPIDAVTGSARYTLNEHNLLRESVNATPFQFLVIPLDQPDQSPVMVRALSCDTVVQFKSKLLDVICKSQPYSARLSTNHFDLVWRNPDRGTVLLREDDQTEIKGFRKLKYLVDYGLPNNALLTMQLRNSCSPSHSSSEKSSASTSPQSCKSYSYYHLEFPSFSTMSTNKLLDSTSNLSAEKSLAQLLTSKGMIQKQINGFYSSILLLENDEIPVVVKYVFDLFDGIARQNNVVDAKLVRSWKINAWTLRFWLVLVANPNCLFDCEQNLAVNYSLAAIGATLTDLLSSTQKKLTKDCTYSEIIFAKDIERQRPNVKAFFRRIKSAKSVTNKQLSEKVAMVSKGLADGMNSRVINSELLSWIRNTGLKLVDALYEDSSAREYHLGQRLSQILNAPFRENEHIYATLQ